MCTCASDDKKHGGVTVGRDARAPFALVAGERNRKETRSAQRTKTRMDSEERRAQLASAIPSEKICGCGLHAAEVLFGRVYATILVDVVSRLALLHRC